MNFQTRIQLTMLGESSRAFFLFTGVKMKVRIVLGIALFSYLFECSRTSDFIENAARAENISTSVEFSASSPQSLISVNSLKSTNSKFLGPTKTIQKVPRLNIHRKPFAKDRMVEPVMAIQDFHSFELTDPPSPLFGDVDNLLRTFQEEKPPNQSSLEKAEKEENLSTSQASSDLELLSLFRKLGRFEPDLTKQNNADYLERLYAVSEKLFHSVKNAKRSHGKRKKDRATYDFLKRIVVDCEICDSLILFSLESQYQHSKSRIQSLNHRRKFINGSINLFKDFLVKEFPDFVSSGNQPPKSPLQEFMSQLREIGTFSPDLSLENDPTYIDRLYKISGKLKNDIYSGNRGYVKGTLLKCISDAKLFEEIATFLLNGKLDKMSKKVTIRRRSAIEVEIQSVKMKLKDL